MRRIIIALGVLLGLCASASAQGGYGNTTGWGITTCGSTPTALHPSTASQPRPAPFTIDANGNMCIAGTFSANLSGFAPGANGTPISVTTAGNTGTLPAGAVVVATNVGTTNAAYCTLGGTGTTAGQYIAPNGGWFAFTVGANTQLTCITSTSTTTINMVGGTGLPTGTGGGGGSGGGGGGAVFGPTANGSPAANPPVLMGGTIDGTATGNVSNLKVVAGIASAALNATPSLANGNGVVPTQGGTALSATNGQFTNILQGNAVLSATNGAYVNLLLGNSASATGAGTTGATTQRVGVAQDTTTIAGSAPGTAGTASANVISVQGIASMTPFLANPGTIGSWGLAASTQNGTTPTNGGLVMGQFNTTPTTVTSGNISPIQMDAAGNLLVNVKAGSASGNVAQGSTTSGNTGPMVQCSVTTSSPTYTTAQTDPLNCDTSGNLRVSVSNTNANGQASAANSSPVVGATGTISGGSTGTAGSAATTVVTTQGIAGGTPTRMVQSTQYPDGAVPITASATGTTAATTATLAGTSGKTTYICSMSIRSNATAAATGNATVTGTITGTLNFTHWTAPLASGIGLTEMIFSPCVPASTTNTGIAVISPAPGTGGVVSSTATGYQL